MRLLTPRFNRSKTAHRAAAVVCRHEVESSGDSGHQSLSKRSRGTTDPSCVYILALPRLARIGF